MKFKIVACLLVMLLVIPAVAAPPKGKSIRQSDRSVDNQIFIDVNSILMFVTNHGNFGRDLEDRFGYDYGTFYPFTEVKYIEDGSNVTSPFYAGGLWMGGIDPIGRIETTWNVDSTVVVSVDTTADTLIIISEYDSEYTPGPMSGTTYSPDQPYYRVYKLMADSVGERANQDWTDYLTYAVPDGAPIRIDTTWNEDSTVVESVDTTLEYGDQYCWSIFNDAYAAQHANDAGATAPMGVEVHQSVWAYDRVGALGNIIFLRWRIFNRGTRTLENCRISIWSDPDMGLGTDDLVGCDTLKSLGYIYNATNNDQRYGTRPPALGIDFFQGPIVETGDMADTARFWGEKIAGYTNLGMVSFNKYINGTDPRSYQQTWWYMQGLLGNENGAPYVYGGDTLTYVHTGNPVTHVGDVDASADDRRMMQTTGPITFAPGDSTEIVAGMIVGRGSSNLGSITVMKFFDTTAQLAYNLNFNVIKPPAKPVVTVGKDDGEIMLSWTDTSEVDTGDFSFQGYTVLQGESPSGPWTEIANYDVINDIDIIRDSVLNVDAGDFEILIVKKGSNTGLQRFFVIDHDFLTNEPLYNYSQYFFKVQAYSYGPFALPEQKTPTSETIVTVIPQRPAVDVPTPSLQELIPATHAAGISGGDVLVEILDPLSLTGDTYRVWFEDTVAVHIDTTYSPDFPGDITHATLDTVNIAWFLQNITTGDTLLAWQWNQTGNDSYYAFDGFMARVVGPGGGGFSFTGFYVTANADGPLDPPEGGAFDFGNFPSARPTSRQQVGDGLWGFHTADNGGTCDGGDRWTYDAFLGRVLRWADVPAGDNVPTVGIYDYEMRFTGSYDNPGVGGGYAIEWYNDDNVFWVPFELWNAGIGTPDDPSDDIRLIPYIIDDGDDDTYNLESWGCRTDAEYGGDGEHSVSGANNDPFTDWVYWRNPADMTPGEAGYDAAEAAMLAGTYGSALAGDELFARTVLVNWNGHTTVDGELTIPPVFTQDLPEVGTIFRLETPKPNSVADTFTFSTAAYVPTRASASDDVLKNIKTVPNPYYLYGPYDPAVGNTQLKFINLPTKCTISIYNLGGDYIAQVEKDDATTSEVSWNVQTRAGLPVASGIYIYVVEAPGIGQKIGKMAIFTESQVLDIY